MRFSIRALLYAAVTIASSAQSTVVAADRAGLGEMRRPSTAGLVVHEWGTFTSFSGSDGVALPFTSQIGFDLPAFVLTRAAQQARWGPDPRKTDPFIFSKGDLVALQRMETPVVYFYSDTPREVSVKVDFPQGLLTEFYPPVRKMTPEFTAATSNQVVASSLDWGRILILPTTIETGAKIPPAEKSHYAHARETDSAIVQFSDRAGALFQEKFLFYRGVGNFPTPVTVKALAGARFVVTAPQDLPVGAAFAMRVEGNRTWFSKAQSVQSGGTVELTLPAEPGSIEALAESITRALISEGLFEKEAKAMVNTWRSSWFGENGTRVLYIVPRDITDRVVPLTITPPPDRTERVFVGRAELLSPGKEAWIEGLLTRAASSGKLPSDEKTELQSLGRFMMPAVERVSHQGKPLNDAIEKKRIDALWNAMNTP